MPFELIASSGPASPRAGLLSLEHGDVPTPVFMPVGTRAAVRTLTSGELEELGAPIILANAYHIWLRPGTEVIERAGGLNAFMSWERPILTDSGGFQVFSLGDTRRIDDDGVTFRSVYDGSERRMTPEISVQVQEALGSDVAMAFDECAPYPSEPGVLAEAVRRSADWAARSKAAHTRPVQELFGILQGGTDVALRRESAERTVGLGFDGYAIGGLSVGEPREEMLATLEATVPLLPEDRPRYLMGVGDPVSMMEAVARGIDMFDSVLPTRMARNGGFWTGEGRLNLRNAEYADDLRPLEEGCGCPACRTYSRAYLRHLLMVKEILPLRMLTEHNLHVLIDGARLAREAILAGAFVDFLDGWRARFDRLGQD
jgi:queuine tRNA-ribosyltransferase